LSIKCEIKLQIIVNLFQDKTVRRTSGQMLTGRLHD
jgi:hypothetical protein